MKTSSQSSKTEQEGQLQPAHLNKKNNNSFFSQRKPVKPFFGSAFVQPKLEIGSLNNNQVRREPSGEEEAYCPHSEIQDEQVERLIQDALDATRPSDGLPYSLGDAHTRLLSDREENCCDVDLAAAERYMFAREMVAKRIARPSIMRGMIRGESGLKWLGSKIGIGASTGNCPQTRTSLSQILWSEKGIRDGQRDRDLMEHESPVLELDQNDN